MLDSQNITLLGNALTNRAVQLERPQVLDLVRKVRAIEEKRSKLERQMSQCATELHDQATEVGSIIASMKTLEHRWTDPSSEYALKYFKEETTNV